MGFIDKLVLWIAYQPNCNKEKYCDRSIVKLLEKKAKENI